MPHIVSPTVLVQTTTIRHRTHLQLVYTVKILRELSSQYKTRKHPESANLRQYENLDEKWSGMNPHLRINPDSDVCQIAPKMLCIHYLVGVSQFAERRENRPVAVWEMLINLLKSTIRQWWERWKSNPESVSGTGSPPKVYQFWLVGLVTTESFNEISWLFCNNSAHRRNVPIA